MKAQHKRLLNKGEAIKKVIIIIYIIVDQVVQIKMIIQFDYWGLPKEKLNPRKRLA